MRKYGDLPIKIRSMDFGTSSELHQNSSNFQAEALPENCLLPYEAAAVPKMYPRVGNGAIVGLLGDIRINNLRFINKDE